MDKNEFRNLAQFLKEKYDAKRVFLFGSYAYGKSTPSSDLDICIITGRQKKRKIELLREIREDIFQHLQMPMDILVYEESEFRERAFFKSTLEHKIEKSGLLISE